MDRVDVPKGLTEVRADRLRGDAGQSAVLVVAVAAVLLTAVLLALVDLGGTVIDRTRAQTAADAAALAGLDQGRAGANRLASRHGATVVAWDDAGEVVTVTVRLGDVTATARATNAP